MEAVQPTLADILGHPLVSLVCTSILALIGWLIVSKMNAIDERIKESNKRDEAHDKDLEELKIKMAQVRTVLGLRDRPSDWVPGQKKGDSSA